MKKCSLVFFVCFALVSAAESNKDMLLESELSVFSKEVNPGFDVAMKLRDAAIADYYKNKKSLLALHTEPLFVPEKDYHIKRLLKQGLPVDQVRACGEMLFVQRPVEGILESVVTAYDQKGREIGELADMQIRVIEGNRVDFLRSRYWQELWRVQNGCITKVNDPQESGNFYKKYSPSAKFYENERKRVVQASLPEAFRDCQVLDVHDSKPLALLDKRLPFLNGALDQIFLLYNTESCKALSLLLPKGLRNVDHCEILPKHLAIFARKISEERIKNDACLNVIVLLNLETKKRMDMSFRIPGRVKVTPSNLGNYLIMQNCDRNGLLVQVLDLNFKVRCEALVSAVAAFDKVSMSSDEEKFSCYNPVRQGFDIFSVKNGALITTVQASLGSIGAFESNFFCIKTGFRKFKIFNFNNVVMPQNDEELDPATLALKIV